MQQITDYLNQKWGAGTFECVIRDSYRNMREIMEQHMDVVEKAKAAFEENGVTPIISPDPRRHGRRAPVLHGAALPESLHRRL